MSSTPFPLGFYSSNPDGNSASAMAQFEQQYNEFSQLMGARPAFMDVFTDFNQAPSMWASNASWAAWSWAMTGSNYVGPGSGTTPVVGIPMASNAGGWANVDTFFQQIIAGDYDAEYAGIVAAWAAQGYTTMEARIGYEFNGNFMPWGPGNSASPTVVADFIAAWQRIATVMHAAGQADGITVQTVWNPADINWTSTPTADLYPGNQYVDIIGTDAYSPTYSLDLTNWSSDAASATDTSQAANVTQWAESATNREHYWQYTNGDQYAPTGSAAGWSMTDAINFAAEMGKPLAIEETGAGGNGSTEGPSDDPAFAQWLASALQQAEAEGVTIENVDIWATDQGDGDWGFLDGEKPAEAASWAANFGVPGATPASQYDATGSNDTSITAPAGAIVAPGGTVSLASLSISDAWAAANIGDVTVVVQANTGTLTGLDMSGDPLPTSGTSQLTMTDTLANVDAELATVGYSSATGGLDAITIDVINQAGNLAAATISINGGTPSIPNPLAGLGTSTNTGTSTGTGTSTSNATSSSTATYVTEATVAQSLGAAGTQVMVTDIAPWAAASAGNPVATEVNGDIYAVIGTSGSSGYGFLTFASPVTTTDASWGNSVAIAQGTSASSSGGAGSSGDTGSSGATSSSGGTPGTYVTEATVAQSLSSAGTQVMVTDMAAWATASASNPIATQVNGDTYAVIGTSGASGYGFLTFATPVTMADASWGNSVAILQGSSSGSGGTATPYSGPYVDEAAVTQSLATAGTQLAVSNVAAWAGASGSDPIPTLVNGDAYLVIGTSAQSGSGSLIFATPVSTADGSWGNNVGIEAALAPAADLPPVTLGSGSTTLALLVSEDAWMGNAEFTVTVDGTQIGGVQTAVAPHGGGDETFDIEGNFAAGANTVTVDFLNDLWGGSAAEDRNLYIDGASVNGTAVAGGTLTLDSGGGQSFTFIVTTPAATDTANGNVTFTDDAGDNLTQAMLTTGAETTTGTLAGAVTQTVEAGNLLAISTTSPLVTAIGLSDLGGASFAVSGFAQTNLTLGGASKAAGSLTDTGAQGGTILLGTGSYAATITAASSGGTAAANTFNIDLGPASVADNVTLNGVAGLTRANVTAGPGTDTVSLVNTAATTFHAGAGTDSFSASTGSNTFIAGSGSLTATGGSGKDIFEWASGDGLMTVTDFNPAQGDRLQFAASLQSSLHETQASGGLMVSFGSTNGSGVLLQGVTTLARSSITWTT